MEKPRGIILTGYPFTGKSTVAKELEKYIPGTEVFDKSTYISHIPRYLGLDKEGALKGMSVDDFTRIILNTDPNLITPEFINNSTRQETVEFSDKIKNHFTPDMSYNYKFLDELVKNSKMPIIAGTRYYEAVKHFADKGFAIYGLTLDNMEEMQKRAHEVSHNGSDWGSAQSQINLEKGVFSVDKIINYITSQKNNQLFKTYDTSILNPNQIAGDIASRLGYDINKLNYKEKKGEK